MSSYAEIYEHERTLTRTIPSPYVSTFYFAEKLDEVLTKTKWVSASSVESSAVPLKYRGHAYRRAVVNGCAEWLGLSASDNSTTLYVRERKGVKALCDRWLRPLVGGYVAQHRNADGVLTGGHISQEGWMSAVNEIVAREDNVLFAMTERAPSVVEKNTVLTAVAWVPAYVLYYGVSVVITHDVRRSVGARCVPSYHWSTTKTDACPHVFLWAETWRGCPHFIQDGVDGVYRRGDEGVDRFPSELRWDNWREHCETRVAAMTSRVVLTVVAGKPTKREAQPYAAIYPALFLSETSSRAGVVPLPARDWSSHAAFRGELPDGVLLLERERVRRGELFADLAAAVFHPLRVERMMNAYGDDWMEFVG